MNYKNILGISALSLLALSCASTTENSVNEAAPAKAMSIVGTPQQHVDKAFELAGDSFMKLTAELQCATDNRAMKYFKDKTVPPATKVFDNLYYVGVKPVGAWAVTTSEGIILIDALSNAGEAENVIEAGLVDLGLNPADIKYIVVTHGHGDHYGGAAYLSNKYGSRVIMDAQDWEIAINAKPRPARPGMPAPQWSPAPAKDMVSTDGQKLTLGDTSVTLFNTPGHTPGTVSVLIPVIDNGSKHTAALWGGTGFPRNKEGISHYVKSTDKLSQYIKDNNVDVVLSNHPFVDDSLNRMKLLGGETHPFVIGKEASITYSQILGECAKAAYLR